MQIGKEWDEERRIVHMDDDWWKQNTLGHYNLKKFRHEPMQWEEELEMIYGRDIVDGDLLLNPYEGGKKKRLLAKQSASLHFSNRSASPRVDMANFGKRLMSMTLHKGMSWLLITRENIQYV